MASTKDPVEMLREKCLSRGSSGIKAFARAFKTFDDDGSRTLNCEEFAKGIRDYGLDIDLPSVKEMFDEFDKDKGGSINFDEFLSALRNHPKMSEARRNVIDKAFKKMDKTGDGVITTKDLKGEYNVRKHPKYLNGEKTEEELFLEFLKSFEPDESKRDGKITKEEFQDYYAGVSASIDGDAYFVSMMHGAYKL